MIKVFGHIRICQRVLFIDSKDAARIIFGKNPQGHRLSNIFRGTRYWEYPWVLEQLSMLPKGAKILDCGCGMSGFPEELARRGYKPTGLDFFVGLKSQKAGYGITDRHIKKLQGKGDFLNGSLEESNCPPKFDPPIVLIFSCYNKHHQREKEPFKEADDVFEARQTLPGSA